MRARKILQDKISHRSILKTPKETELFSPSRHTACQTRVIAESSLVSLSACTISGPLAFWGSMACLFLFSFSLL